MFLEFQNRLNDLKMSRLKLSFHIESFNIEFELDN